MWEDVEKGVFRKNKRIRTVLKFENVIKVYSKNINQVKEKIIEVGFLLVSHPQIAICVYS